MQPEADQVRHRRQPEEFLEGVLERSLADARGAAEVADLNSVAEVRHGERLRALHEETLRPLRPVAAAGLVISGDVRR